MFKLTNVSQVFNCLTSVDKVACVSNNNHHRWLQDTLESSDSQLIIFIVNLFLLTVPGIRRCIYFMTGNGEKHLLD